MFCKIFIMLLRWLWEMGVGLECLVRCFSVRFVCVLFCEVLLSVFYLVMWFYLYYVTNDMSLIMDSSSCCCGYLCEWVIELLVVKWLIVVYM